MRKVRVSDATMRRAAGSKQLALSFKEKLEMAKILDRLSVSAIEVEGIESVKADSLRIKSIASLVKDSVVTVPVQMDEANIDLVWAAVKGAKHPRLQVEAAVSPARMEYVYRKKADAMQAGIVAAIEKCTRFTDDVEFIADDATRADQAFLRSVIADAIKAGATTITVCDAAGTMLPEEFAQFITALRADIPQLDDVVLGVSCSNELYMADACAIAAIIAGVDEIKATAYPMDMVSLPKLSKILADKSDACQATSTVRITEMKRAAAQIAWLCESGKAKNSHFDTQKEADDSIVLTANDDQEAVTKCAAKLGYELSEEDAAAVYEAFLRIASKKESVGSRELDAIIASAALQVPPTYVLERYVINSGNVIKATAIVRMRKGDETIEKVGVGDGPIDAAFAAVEQIVGKPYDLDDWQMAAVTEGQEAMGEAVIRLVSEEGKVYSGRGISTDIIGSSIRAYVNALNKIVYEEQNEEGR